MCDTNRSTSLGASATPSNLSTFSNVDGYSWKMIQPLARVDNDSNETLLRDLVEVGQAVNPRFHADNVS